jgi:hypothetical protein
MSPRGGEPATTLRLAREDDLPTCAEIHRVSIDECLVAAGQPTMTWAGAPLVAGFSRYLPTGNALL